jgi:hypothetical protein
LIGWQTCGQSGQEKNTSRSDLVREAVKMLLQNDSNSKFGFGVNSQLPMEVDFA